MENHRFRLSDMISNAWIYKLKDIGRSKNHSTNQHVRHKKQNSTVATSTKLPSSLSSASSLAMKSNQSSFSEPRKSYHISRENIYDSPQNRKFSNTHFRNPPRKSNQTRPTRKSSPKHFKSSISAKPESDSSEYSLDTEFNDRSLPRSDPFSSSTSRSCKIDKLDEFDSVSDLKLAPIQTKPTKIYEILNSNESLSVKLSKKQAYSIKKQSQNSPRVKLRLNSPRIGSRRFQMSGRKSISSPSRSSTSSRNSVTESFAVVKFSNDPQRDFRDSMVEMIVENNIRESKDLEELLACYLTLNSDEYHGVIIKVFKQLWFDHSNIRFQ